MEAAERFATFVLFAGFRNLFFLFRLRGFSSQPDASLLFQRCLGLADMKRLCELRVLDVELDLVNGYPFFLRIVPRSYLPNRSDSYTQ